MRTLAVIALCACCAAGFAQGAARRPMDGSDDPKVLPALEKAYKNAKATFEKKPKDAKAKEAFVTAGVKYGHESMMSPLLAPRVKYGQALRIYREVLKVDPKNPVAKQESELIIGIYKSMGRPVPK